MTTRATTAAPTRVPPPVAPFVKVCGITRAGDAAHAVAQGASALGFVFWPRSPRYVTPAAAAAIIAGLPPAVLPVGVFVNETVDGIRAIVAATGIGAVQLHGDEPAAYAAQLGRPLLRSVALGAAAPAGAADAWPLDAWLLVDAHDPVRRGGTGDRADWARAALLAAHRRVVLAGGLTPDNVAAAVSAVRPFGVDVSSGVEASPGIKDPEKVARFVAHARAALLAAAHERQDTT